MTNPDEPMERDPVRELTTRAEAGENISWQLNDMPFRERAVTAHAIEKLNRADRKADGHLSHLELTFGTDGNGEEHLLNMESQGQPDALIFKDGVDVYNLPGFAEIQLSTSLKMAVDIFNDKTLPGQN